MSVHSCPNCGAEVVPPKFEVATWGDNERLIDKRNDEREKRNQYACGIRQLKTGKIIRVGYGCLERQLAQSLEREATEKARADTVEAENAEHNRHLDNALFQAKEVCPDYPWTVSPTMSEIAWAVCSSLKGVGLACGDWEAKAKRLREALERIAKCKDNPDPMGYLPAIAAEALTAKEGES